MRRRAPGRRRPSAARILPQENVSLLDLVDNLLNRGVVLTGDVVLGVADVDLIYLRLSLLLTAMDKIFPAE